MGQRLNIEIHDDGQLLANAYYHWSGYTSSALSLTERVMDNIKLITIEDKVAKAIKLLEATGATLTDADMAYAKETIDNCESYEFKNSKHDRNEGLLSITHKGMIETRTWEEARVEIDITKETISFEAIWTCDKEEYEEDYEGLYADLEIVDIDFYGVPFEDFSHFEETLTSILDSGEAIRTPDGTAVIMIE